MGTETVLIFHLLMNWRQEKEGGGGRKQLIVFHTPIVYNVIRCACTRTHTHITTTTTAHTHTCTHTSHTHTTYTHTPHTHHTHTHTSYTPNHTHTHTYTHTPYPDSHSLTHTPPHSTHPVLKAHERDVAGTSEHGVCHVWYTSEGVLQNQRQDPSKDRTEQQETDRKHSSERVKETQGHVDNTKRECNDFSECLPNSCMALGETNFPASSFL